MDTFEKQNKDKTKVGIFSYDLDGLGGSGKTMRELMEWLSNIGDGALEIIPIKNSTSLYEMGNQLDNNSAMGYERNT